MKRTLLLASLLVATTASSAALKPESVHTADNKKSKAYIRDGLFVGGDRAVNEVTVRDIRRAANAGFERLVIDLEGNKDGEPVAISRPPYFQVAVSPEEKRLIFTIWGAPKLGFDSRKVIGAFKKSPIVQSVELLPRLDDTMWTFVVGLKGDKPVEVFELSNPVRIIVDIRTDSRK